MSTSRDDEPRCVEIAVAVVRHAGKYLIGKRPASTPLAGYWEFPGGKLEPGESPEAAAVRECLEETGLAVRVVGEYPAAEHCYPHATVRLHFLACECVDEPTKNLPPRFCWATAAELADYIFPPANAALLEILCAR